MSTTPADFLPADLPLIPVRRFTIEDIACARCWAPLVHHGSRCRWWRVLRVRVAQWRYDHSAEAAGPRPAPPPSPPTPAPPPSPPSPVPGPAPTPAPPPGARTEH